MPPAIAAVAAYGATFASAIGVTSAAVTAVVSSVFVGAAIGAVVGAATSLITGQNVLKGALRGAGVGAVGGAVAGVAGQAMNSAATVGEVGVGEVGAAGADVAGGLYENAAVTGLEQAGGTAAAVGPTVQNAAALPGAAQVASTTGQQVAAQAAKQPKGFLSGVTDFVKTDAGGEILGRTAASAAEGMLTARSNEKALEAAMERDKLMIANQKIDLSGIDFKVALPTIAGFTKQQQWMPTGLLGGANDPSKTATANA